MKQMTNQAIKLLILSLLSSLLVISTVGAQSVVSAAQATKLAKQFDVSPDLLSKFSKMSLKDMKSGLDIAKKVSGKGSLSMDEATDKVMNAAKDGRAWADIAADFGVDSPADVGEAAKATEKLKDNIGKDKIPTIK